MATAGPTPGGFVTRIPDLFHAPMAGNTSYMTIPIGAPAENAANLEANRLTNALKARKRTKTGCLTCRKRRIKCGEERPTCKNCTKSKRDCEGYIPRVVFKEPNGGSGISLQGPYFAQGYNGSDSASMFGDPSAASAEGAPYQAIAPRPSFNGAPAGFGALYPSNGHWAAAGFTYMQPHPVAFPPGLPYSTQPAVDPHGNPGATANIAGPYRHLNGHAMTAMNNTRHSGAHNTSITWPYSPASTISRTTLLPSTPAQDHFYPPDQLNPSTTQARPLEHECPQEQSFSGSVGLQPFLNETSVGDRYLRPISDASQDFVNELVHLSNRAYDPTGAAVSPQQEPEDDWFDVDSEDEASLARTSASQANLGMMIARNAQQDQRSNVLSTYNPAYAASPLKDPMTARIFCHFITQTAPTLNVCERHPSNPAVIFSGRPVPKSQQALWSYTLPMLALRHQGLLHSMLALASIHISQLQKTPPTPSLRHYHYALRRVAKALGDVKRRRDPATLAATLLLGHYEVLTTEHNKWNSHLSGARELIVDAPYVKLAKRVDAYWRKKAAQEALSLPQNGHNNSFFQAQRRPNDIPTFDDGSLDQDLISTLMGWDIRYGKTGKILNDREQSPEPEEHVSARDIDEYEVQLDLFWWYAKQDTYQSILSGNRLLLTYDRWAMCPPRAAMGRVDAVHGTMDHLLLLLARLADWASKDLSRKKRAGIEAERAAKAARNSPPSSTHTSPGHPPPMYGMIPDPGPVRVPSGFSQEQHDQMYTSPPKSESQPLDVALNEALVEWSSIAQAFDVFYSHLGPSYEPLSPEHMTPHATPFGPAMFFRSYAIACVLHLYYTGRIILARTHPKMPPAAMVAALVAKRETERYCTAIGRICAGIQPVSNTAPLNPHHGAALMDCCMGLFHASIVYTEYAQRIWTVSRLRDVSRLTGWQTSSLVAAGCERAWMHYASIGKGPPYERTTNQGATDDRVAGRSRDPEHLKTEPKDNNDRRFVKVNAGTRVYWAMGILSVEEDMKEMNLGES